MKKLGMTLLAVALSLPFALVAQAQTTQQTPAATKSAATKTKAKHTKKRHHKKVTQTNLVQPATK